MIEALKTWKQTAQFCAQVDWIFASPAQLGRLPWSADSVNDAYMKAAPAAGIAHVSTHSMRHTYRSWLDAVGTPIAVQQKLMRHADIRNHDERLRRCGHGRNGPCCLESGSTGP